MHETNPISQRTRHQQGTAHLQPQPLNLIIQKQHPESRGQHKAVKIVAVR